MLLKTPNIFTARRYASVVLCYVSLVCLAALAVTLARPVKTAELFVKLVHHIRLATSFYLSSTEFLGEIPTSSPRCGC